jgi:hypothetical protein
MGVPSGTPSFQFCMPPVHRTRSISPLAPESPIERSRPPQTIFPVASGRLSGCLMAGLVSY